MVSQVFDFSDVCPLQGLRRTRFQPAAISGLSGAASGNPATAAFRSTTLQGIPGEWRGQRRFGVDKNALAILQANLIPLPNSPTGCNFTVANVDPTDPNHCYNAAVSPSTYWREELFHVDQLLTPEVARFVPLHP